MRRHPFPIALAATVGSGCPADPDPIVRYDADQIGENADIVCPGDPSGACDFGGDATLLVGAAALPITPTEWETWIDVDGDNEFRTSVDQFLDCGADRLCPGDANYPGPDKWEGNDIFDAMWLAGFGTGRPMRDIADATWARATVLSQGETSLGIIALDVVGFFYNEVEEIREVARNELGIDHVVVVSTHVHEAPDTMGIWGPQIAYSGVNPESMPHIHDQMREALRQAQQDAVAADLRIGSHRVPDDAWEGRGINNITCDGRDPNIVDPMFKTARFVAAGTDETIATWINFANHPEAAGDENVLLTSDYVHTERLAVEEGLPVTPTGPLAGLGGVAVHLSGAVGGMMSPLACNTIDVDGVEHTEDDLAKAYAVGRVTGYHALQAVAAEQAAMDTTLRFRTKSLMAPVENRGYHIMIQLGIFDRDAYNYDASRIVGPNNQPDLRTEVDVIEIGPVGIATIPGELLPELAWGGYDGTLTGPLQELIDPGNANPPNLALAPTPPYLGDQIPGDLRMVWALANDELGYIIPDYDYKVHDTNPFLDEPEGDHYEETNSLGPSARGLIVGASSALLAWEPPPLSAAE